MELLIRFVIGGLFVCLFAALGDCCQPKSFAGLFSAAPSIALTSLLLVWHEHGAGGVTIQSRSMVLGAVAMILYALTCAWIIRKPHVKPWLATGALLGEWLGAALLLYGAILR